MGIAYALLPIITFIEKGDSKGADSQLLHVFKNPNEDSSPLLSLAIYHLLRFMTDKEYPKACVHTLYAYSMRCIQQNQLLAAHLLHELLATTDQYQSKSKAFLEKSMIKLRFLELINVKDSWEYSFQALEGLLLDDPATSGGVSPLNTKRLLWLIDTDKQTVDVLEQSLNKSGQWTPGKTINLSKLKYYNQHEQFNYLSAADRLAINFIVMKDDAWHSN